ALKSVVGRERPNGSNHRSFPSGHSYAWFSMATIVDLHYSFGVALPAYAAWALSSLSRMANNTHYLSDVVAGAALGYLGARTTKRVNDESLPGGGRRLRVDVGLWKPGEGSEVGVQLAISF